MEKNKSLLVEAAAEFLSRGTSTNPLVESSPYVRSSAYTPEKYHDGEPIPTTLYRKYYQQRAMIHGKESKSASDADDKKVHQGHAERAKAAHEAHNHAISVHNSSTASPNEKHDAVKKAVHAELKYWKHGPLSGHDQRNDRAEDDYHANSASALSHSDMKHIK